MTIPLTRSLLSSATFTPSHFCHAALLWQKLEITFDSLRSLIDNLTSQAIRVFFSVVEVPNSNLVSCSNSSLLECSPVRYPAETCLSSSEDGDDLG